MEKFKKYIFEHIGILLPSIIIVVLAMPLGIKFTEDSRKLGAISLFVTWIVLSPFLICSCFILNYVTLYAIERCKKESLRLSFIFLVGTIVSALINLLFWINIKLFSL